MYQKMWGTDPMWARLLGLEDTLLHKEGGYQSSPVESPGAAGQL